MSGHLILGKDTANNKYVPISVDSSGHLDIDVQVADLDSKCMVSVDGTTSGTQKQARCDTDGRLITSLIANDGNDGGGTNRFVGCNSNGFLKVKDDELELNYTNGVFTTQMAGRTTISDSNTKTNLLCDADGHLKVDVVSMSGGGDASAANQTTQIANDATIIGRIGTTNSTLGTISTNQSTAANQTTINTSIGTVNTSVGTVNSTLGDTNSKIDAMRGTSDLGVINTSLGTVNTSIGTSNSTLTDIEAHQGNIENNLSSIQSTVSSNKLQVDVITTALPTGAATQATLADVEAHQGNIENNLSSIQSTVSSNKLQVDVITSALPSGAATETTLAAAEVHLGAIDTSCSSIQSNVSTSSNQGTMITSLASLAGCVSGNELQVDIVSGGGGGGGGDASAANQTTMITHLSEIEGAVETIETCVSGTELQVDVITSALPSGAATEATLAAAEAHIGTIDTSTASVAGCVAGTEVQVDVRNRTDSAPVALTFSTGNKIIAASTATRTGTIDVGGCSSYVIMMNMLTATTNSSDFANTDVSIEYSPDDGSTFMGTSSMSGGLEIIEPKALYQATGSGSSTVVGYGVYIQSTATMASPLMGVARTNKIRLAVQNPSGSALTLDTFAIYKFN